MGRSPSRRSPDASPDRTLVAARGRPVALFVLLAGLMVLVLAVPVLMLLWRGLTSDPLRFLADPTVQAALRLSAWTSSLATAAALILGMPLAYLLARNRFPGRTWLEVLVDLPIVLPPAVAGIALLAAFGRRSLIGAALAQLGISLPFTTAAVVLAQVFVAAPLFIRAARIGFNSVDVQIEEAAYTEGASQWQLFRHVMFPLTGRALFAGLVLCWARALGEFGATILFAGNLPGRTQTMPLAIFIGFQQDIGIALALASILLVVSGLVLAVLRRVESEARLY
ncbi:MAG: ABC transporter permease [Anaerolineales bacterium]|nr:ABC transporter permease [Anaerolineales bacterium]